MHVAQRPLSLGLGTAALSPCSSRLPAALGASRRADKLHLFSQLRYWVPELVIYCGRRQSSKKTLLLSGHFSHASSHTHSQQLFRREKRSPLSTLALGCPRVAMCSIEP
ncbi:hypothetical protein NDU88_006641 [Pleurodeles waltl]|uniref:Secreted protein n=1 Tax=Pleurodeles waltl TaxID=8319 RepID=A0AAV7PIY6_PLEWA|nr:hypothetical protein NDU88_006641 [Pleurodeles waltl]